jgi:thiamine pyrophosphate-dependent acetolactate synthase large subunit-like protein
MHALELATAVRHRLPVVCVVNNEAGWTAREPGFRKPGRELGHTRYDKTAESLGCCAAYVEQPEDIRPALERAFAAGRPALVNVVTDPLARAVSVRASAYHAVESFQARPADLWVKRNLQADSSSGLLLISFTDHGNTISA